MSAETKAELLGWGLQRTRNMDTRNLDKTTKLLYSIRRFGEISLYDLFREFVSAENGKEFSDALYFSEDILSLIKKNYVKMYSTDLHRAKLSFEYEDVSDLSWAEDMVRRTVWKILHPNSVKDKEKIDPKKVFLASTQELDSLQQKIGFSITRQAKWIWREENCEELFGSVKREKNDCVFVIMPFEGNIKHRRYIEYTLGDLHGIESKLKQFIEDMR